MNAADTDVLTTALADALAELKRLRAEIKEFGLNCGNTNGQYKCNIHRGHGGRHMAATNGHVLDTWS